MSDMDDTQTTAPAPHPGYIVVDTEGTGLFNYKEPADADGQPRLAEIVMIFADENMVVEKEYHAYIRPDGWEMSEGASKVNGLTTEFLNENGLGNHPQMMRFTFLASKAISEDTNFERGAGVPSAPLTREEKYYGKA